MTDRSEIPGSVLACESLDIREGLTVAGVPITGGGGQVISARLIADVSSVAIPPVYSTLFSVPITATAGSQRLLLEFAAAPRHVGAAINVAINFRMRIDTVLVAPGGGTTINLAVNAIGNAVYKLVVPMAPGLHTVDVEWAGFGLGLNTMFISPVLLPNLQFAQLVLTELL